MGGERLRRSGRGHREKTPTSHTHALFSLSPPRRPVLLFGEKGLEKQNLAALVHFGGPAHGLLPIACIGAGEGGAHGGLRSLRGSSFRKFKCF